MQGAQHPPPSTPIRKTLPPQSIFAYHETTPSKDIRTSAAYYPLFHIYQDLPGNGTPLRALPRTPSYSREPATPTSSQIWGALPSLPSLPSPPPPSPLPTPPSHDVLVRRMQAQSVYAAAQAEKLQTGAKPITANNLNNLNDLNDFSLDENTNPIVPATTTAAPPVPITPSKENMMAPSPRYPNPLPLQHQAQHQAQQHPYSAHHQAYAPYAYAHHHHHHHQQQQHQQQQQMMSYMAAQYAYAMGTPYPPSPLPFQQRSLDENTMPAAAIPTTPAKRPFFQQKEKPVAEPGIVPVPTTPAQAELLQLLSNIVDGNVAKEAQERLLAEGSAVLPLVLPLLAPQFAAMMDDPHGNYIAQALVTIADADTRFSLISATADLIPDAALHIHGTRTVQKMVETATSRQSIAALVSLLQPMVITLMKSPHGNHVLQRVLTHFDHADSAFIHSAVLAEILDVGRHRHGCCVVQRACDHGAGSSRQAVIAAVIAETLALANDPFGNYIVQYVLDNGTIAQRDAIAALLMPAIAQLAVCKYSSNVIEKSIKVSSATGRSDLVAGILQPDVLQKLAFDSFGNYVIQTALTYTSGPDRATLVTAITSNLALIRKSKFGARIISKLAVSNSASDENNNNNNNTLGPKSSYNNKSHPRSKGGGKRARTQNQRSHHRPQRRNGSHQRGPHQRGLQRGPQRNQRRNGNGPQRGQQRV